MLFGSSIVLMPTLSGSGQETLFSHTAGAKPRLGAPRITPIMPSLLDMCRKGGFITPTPCSAEMEPRRSAIHSKTYGSMAACDQLPLVTHRL